MLENHIPEFEIVVGGDTNSTSWRQRITGVDFESNLDKPDRFTLNFADPDLRLLDDGPFFPGQRIELSLGYSRRLQKVLVGVVETMQPAFPANGLPTLQIAGCDLSQQLHKTSFTVGQEKISDVLLVLQLALQFGLTPKVTGVPRQPNPVLPQGSVWAVLKQLARRNNFEVRVIFDELHFGPPLPERSKIVLEYGKNLLSFSPRFNPSQATKPEVRAKNAKTGETIVQVMKDRLSEQ
ncbi:MAG: hypothetical protein KDA84_07920, partial [Planctomycetaceae bacterium]|nr:hypothetical protein [Planctomycetaceae bacterium]